MISVNNLVIAYSGIPVFDEISFRIEPQDRIGLAGKNGSGKSTLLKTLAGQIVPESGETAFPKGSTTGYLPQEMDNLTGGTLYEEVEKAFAEVLKLQESIEEATNELINRTDYHTDEYLELATRVSEWNESLNMAGGNKIEAQIEQVLKGLGFNKEDFTKDVSEFSGGWQMRIYLAKLLLEQPDLLLLDEPTNHLDIDSVRWLERFLLDYEGAIMVVSHDRRFLDKLTNRTLELELGKLYDYKAHYSKYRELRQQRKDNELAAWKNQQTVIKQNEEFIDRFRYKASKASQVQSRIKQMEKMDKIVPDDEDTSGIKFRFPDAPRSGKVVTETVKLNKSYGDLHVLKDIDFSMQRGEKIAFLGRNGEGKSSFARILAGKEPYDGHLKTGHNVLTAYFAQHRTEELKPEETVLEAMESNASNELRPKLRSILGAFLFTGNDVYKKTKVLSGGEKSRLSLARLLLQPSNFLILDEPTNHLDMSAKDVLKQALNQFTGAMVVVSHDREFLEGLVTRCCEFKDGKIKDYPDDINYYLQRKREEESEAQTVRKQTAKNAAINEPDAPGRPLSHEERKALRNKRNKVKNGVKKAEKEINSLEEKIAELETGLSQPNAEPSLFSKHEELQKKLSEAMQEWEKWQKEWEEMKSKE